MSKSTEPNTPYPPEDLPTKFKSAAILLGGILLIMVLVKFIFGL